MPSPAALEALRGRSTAYPVAHPHAAAGYGQPPEVAAFLAACDGRTRFDDLLARHALSGEVAGVLGSLVWLEHRRDDIAAPSASAPRMLILSATPHAGWLAMGGHVLAQRGSVRPLLVSCFSSVVYDDESEVRAMPFAASAAGRDEGAFCAALFGADTAFLDIPDWASRMALASGEVAENELAIRAAVRLMLQHLIAAEHPADVFAPAALADDPDQRMLFEIALEIFEDAFFTAARFHLYEDIPAAGIQVDHFLARFESSYLDVTPWNADITSQLEQKGALAGAFASSAVPDAEGAIRRASLRNARWSGQPGAAYERFWTLRLAMADREAV